jgi:hypothetical protein
MTLLRIVMLAAVAVFVHADDITDDLLAAARKGDAATVKALLDRGANVNAKSPYGSTALFFAADHGHADVVKLLLDRGAEVNVEDTFYHSTPLTWATQKRNPEIVKALLDHGAKSPATVLMAGVQSGNAAFVKIALESSKGKDAIDAKTLTAALGAATGKTEIIEMLKAAGAEPIKTAQVDEATLTAYAGSYTGTIQGMELEMIFTVKGGNLSGTLVGQPAVTYAPSDKTHFHSVEVPGVDLEFGPDTLHLKQGGFSVDFKKKGQPK